MSIRDHYTKLGISVPKDEIPDSTLEAIGLDILAEFGELEPTVDQIREIVERHRAKPAPETPAYIPSIDVKTLLDFEAEGILPRRRKVREIRERFGVTETVYVALLNRALDDPEAMLYQPVLVARLTRIRDGLRAKRTGWRGRVSA